jgi:hypothetical protein
MAKCLARKHDVEFYADHGDPSGMGMWKEPDFSIINHRPMVKCAKGRTFIYTCHSVFHEVEQYPDGVDCIRAAPSEEIALKHKDVTVIHQPIDMEKFCQSRPVNRVPKTILYLCNPNYAEAHDIVKEAFKGFELLFIDKPVADIEQLIDKADVVVSLGRGCYEALAMGRNVISGDKRSYMPDFAGGGMITAENFEHLLKTNLSSRDNLIHFTPDTLRKELDKYDPDRVIDMSRFNAEKIADEYVNLWMTNTNPAI